jgi:hypothetical protein
MIKTVIIGSVALSCTLSNAQELLFNLDPFLTSKGNIQCSGGFISQDGFGLHSSEFLMPTIRYGLTDSIEILGAILCGSLKQTYFIKNIDYKLPLIKQDELNTLYSDLDELIQFEDIYEDSIVGISDVISLIKWEKNAYYAPECSILYTTFGGFAFPGTLNGTPEIMKNNTSERTVYLPLGYNSGVTSILLGASSYIQLYDWYLLNTILINVERMNRIGNRSGHMIIGSLALGKTLTTDSKQWGSCAIECDVMHHTGKKFHFGNVLDTDSTILWAGPILSVSYHNFLFKGGIQSPIWSLNSSHYSHRYGIQTSISF